jgi:UDP-N-acetylglucosamine 1-carboxyvinyltransferase
MDPGMPLVESAALPAEAGPAPVPVPRPGEHIYRVRGGHRLEGTHVVHGSKNAALPILAATLLTQDPCVLENVPDISDIRVMIEVLRHLGARVTFDGPGRVIVEAAEITSRTTPMDLATRLRGSFLVMGPLLARFGQASAPQPGGCVIGPRPMDVQIKGFGQLGAQVAVVDDRFAASGKLCGTELVLDTPSQTGTENLIMAATLADGITIIENACVEPDVLDMVTCLRAMGARIAWTGPATVAVQGVPRLHGATYRISPDRFEAGTYLFAGAITRGDVTVEHVLPQHLHAVIAKLKEAGATIDQGPHWVRIRVDRPLTAVDVRTYQHPGFHSDIQQPFGALLTQAHGESSIYETMYTDRMRYVYELAKLGADVEVNGQTAIFRGPAHLKGTEVRGLDLRGGAAAVLAGLVADGETTVRDAHLIERGYTHFAASLRALGADCSVETGGDSA